MPAKTSGWTGLAPPTLMSRSDSLVAPPVTKAWAMTTENRAERPARSARTPLRRGARGPGMGAPVGAQRVGRGHRLEVGQRVDRGVADQDGGADVLQPG